MEKRPKMSREERAKQFMPFAALKGYQDVLREKEKIRAPRAELSEEYAAELDLKLRSIRKRDMVTVIYFCEGEYLKVTGMVAAIDRDSRILKVVNTKIPLGDIYDVCQEE